MKKGKKGFDWYAARQRFSIRKFHFGAASVLLGVSLVLGSGMQLVSAEEATPPITEELVVTEEAGENDVPAVETSASNQKGEEASTLVKETNKSEEIEPLPTRSAQITYVIDYVDEAGQLIWQKTHYYELETQETVAVASLTVEADLPEGYRLADFQESQLSMGIVEGAENRIVFTVQSEASQEDAVDTEKPESPTKQAETSLSDHTERIDQSEQAFNSGTSDLIIESPEAREAAKEETTKVERLPLKVEHLDLPTQLEEAKEVFEQVISEGEVLSTEAERYISITDPNNEGLRVAAADTKSIVSQAKTNIIRSVGDLEAYNAQITLVREKMEVLAFEMRKLSPDGEIRVALAGTSNIASGANDEATDGSDSTAYTGSMHFKNYDEADLTKIKRQITWLDFGDSNAWTGLDRVGSSPALAVGATYRKEISPGYVVEIRITELKPFESTEVYRDRVKGTDMEWTYNPNAVNSNMKTYANGKTDYGITARIIAAEQDSYSNAKVQGFDVPGKVTLRSNENGGNVGVKFATKATYLGNVVPLNMVFMSGEEAGNSEFETYITNGEAFELFGELSNSNTVSSYKVVDNWLDYNDQVSGHSADWKAMFDSRYWANIATEESLKTAIQSARYRNDEPTMVVDGVGTKVFGPVSNHLKSFFSTPIIMTKNATEVGMYIMSSGRQSGMIGVALLDYGDAPVSYGTGAHSINFNEADRQPYLGSKPADIDFIPEGIPNGSVPWYRDELINQFDEGPDQLMGSSVESGVNYTLHHSNNGSYALRFTANTNNNDKAYVQGWIDFNNDGRFDESENSGILEVVRGKTEYTLHFRDIYQNVDTSVTKLGVRMRIALEAADIRTPNLTAYSGEVEDFQIQLTHPPRGTKKETSASQGETQTATVEFFAYGHNTYETTWAKIDENVPPSIVKENGQLVQDSELVDGYYVVPGEGRYKITASGKDVSVEFIPEAGFVTKRADGSIVKQAKGITIRRTSTVMNQEGTAAYTTGWTATTDVHGVANISDQTNTMDGRYIPHVVAVVPSGIDATSSAVQGAVQTGRPTFVPGTTSTGAQVPMDTNTTKLLDDSSNPVDTTTAYAMVNGVRTAVGEYTISRPDGTVTYTPNEEGKRFIGSLLPVTVQSKDVNGSAATATYTPTITPLSPTAVAATSIGVQGKEQTGRPTFAKGSQINGVGELVPSTLTLLDASGQPATRVEVPNQGSYVLNPDGRITFTPLPNYYGTPTPVSVRQADSNGTTVVTTYSPNVIEVRPIADPDKTYGLKGAEQTSRSDFFTAGQIDLNGDQVYNPASEVVALNPASRKLINQKGQEVDSVQVDGEGVYRLNSDGTITFTPEPNFVGLASGVTITIADVNGTKVSTTYVPKVIDIPEDELRETVKRTIRYIYADGREASASVEKVLQYTRTATANPLTGDITYSPWVSADDDFPEVASPVIPNYTASQLVVAERTNVPAEAVDETITIVYREHDKQLATFTYRVVDGPELAKDQEIGYSSAPIAYTTVAKIAEIKARGYELVDDRFTRDQNKTFDRDTARVQNWDILFRPKTSVTTPDNPQTPGTPVDPTNPNGPRWEEVTKTITRTVSYKLNEVDGPEAPGTSSQSNTVTFERTGTYNFVSNQITYTNWTAKNNDATLEGYALPEVLGYTATKARANGEEVLPLSTTRNKTVTHQDSDITEIVVYTPNTQIGKISFINVTNPSQEVLVEEIALTGKTGETFTVDTTDTIEKYRQLGYEVRDMSNYDKDGVFSPDPNSHDEFVYHLTERVVPYDPENPDPTIPKWPDSVKGIVTKDEVKRTISYVDEAGAPLSPAFEDTVSFTRTATVNLITGAVTYGPWQAVDSDKELAGNPLPSLAGYSVKRTTSDAIEVEASVTETPRLVEAEAADIVEVVTYQKDRQEAIIRFVDVTNPQAKKELNTISLSGKSSEEIGYDVTPLVNSYEASGYLVSNKHSYAPTTPYDTDKDVPQEFVFELVQKTTPSTPDNPQTPGTPVDPTNPNGPRWEEVTKTITRTVAYKLDTVDGQPVPNTESKTNSVTFERTGSYNHVTKQVTYTEWTAKDKDTTLEGQVLPLVTGYVATTATRNSQTVAPGTTAEAIEATATTDNVDEIVVYKALSSWTITPPPGTDPVPPIPYPNHPTDPTKPGDPTPTPAIPKVDGYVPVGPDGNELPKDPDGNYIPPVPTDPTQPTVITYKALEQKVIIKYLEEGTNKVLSPADEVTGLADQPIVYSTAETIALIEERGYELVQDNFPRNATYDRDSASPQVYTVVFREKVVTTTPDNPQTPGTPVDPTNPNGPKWPDGLKESDLNQTVTRTIKYLYEDGSEAQSPVVETLTYKRTATVNLATKEVTYGDWTSTDDDFDKVDTPAIVGYTPDKASVAAEADVPATTQDSEIVVTYVKDAQKATITYQDETGKTLGKVDEVTGKSGEPIDYTTSARITELTNQGYEVVTDGFTKEGGQVFDRDKTTDQTFIVLVKAKVVPINPDNPQTPGTPVDPTNPNGPKWPDGLKESDLNQTVTRTIKYLYEDGSPVLHSDGSPMLVTQRVAFKRSATVNLVSGQVTYGAWSENQTVPAVPSPIVSGYYTEIAVVAAHTFSATDTDKTVSVVYKKLGSWTITPPSGTDPIPPIPYPNHPTDPTKPGTDLPVLPHVPGFIPVGPDGVTPLPPVDPDDPSKGYILPPIPSDPGADTPITYVPEAPKSSTVTVKYVDESGKDLLPPVVTEGKVGDSYTSEGKVIEGYLLKEIPSNATGTMVEGGTVVAYVYVPIGSWIPNIPGQPVTPIPYPNHPTDPTKPGDAVPTLPHVPGFIPVGPDGVTPLPPVDPDDPSKGYELPPIPTDPGVDTPITYVPEAPKLSTVTVKYVDESGKDLLPPVVTEGKVGDTYTSEAKVIPGYLLKEYPSNQTGTIPEGGTVVSYIYIPIGAWVPNIPGQPVTPIPYPNHPTDPTKPGDGVPTLPHVPGFIPVGPDGVTPLTPVDPSDPSKGYELPPIPTDPGVDTPITYVPEAPKSSTVTVKYVDESGKELIPSTKLEGKVGDSYTSEGKVIEGYLLKEIPSNATGTMVEGGTVVTYVYIPIGSWIPNIPGQPVTPIPYPNHPTDPTKPGDGVPTLPHVPGFIPVGPDGVTPLQPVDPDDPSKGYELPPIPTDPGVDTPITYVPEAPKVIAKPSPPKSSPIVPSVVQPATKSEALPNTGEIDSSVLSLLGLSMLTATKIGLKKRRED
ncbi:TPA: MucBP domain-containing protein [Streptococcus suis]